MGHGLSFRRLDPTKPKGPKGEECSADVIGNAIKIARIATGEEEDTKDEALSFAAAEMGRRGGKARAEKPTKEQPSEISKKAAEKRWKARE